MVTNNSTQKDSIVVVAQMLDDGTLQLRIEDPHGKQVSDATVVRPDPMGALSDTRVGRAFLQLCGVPLMSQRVAGMI